MSLKLFTILISIILCDSALYSSFYAPLFDRRILNYQVDIPFDPNAGQTAREQYVKMYGYRGERLIADLGNGKRPGDSPVDDKVYGEVKFYYT